MVKILIVTHGPLAEGFKESARMFFADAVDEKIDTIGLYPGDVIEDLKDKITASIKQNNTEDGTLIFVDMLAGSPFNMVGLVLNELKDEYKLECITGINMPLLMEALASADSMDLSSITDIIEELAPQSVLNAKKILGL